MVAGRTREEPKQKVNSSSSISIAMTIAISVWPFGLQGKAHGSRARAHDSLMGSCAFGGVGLEYLPWISVRARLGVRKKNGNQAFHQRLIVDFK